MKIKKCFNEISLDWLLLGEGNMIESSDKETISITSDSLDERSLTENREMKTLFENESEKAPEANSNHEQIQPDINKENTDISSRRVNKVILLFDDGYFVEYKK